MTKPYFWIVLVLISIAYLSTSFSKDSNKVLQSAFYIGEDIKADLSLIPTSPRWKYPYGNHNASLNEHGAFVFQKSGLPIISINIKEGDFFGYQKGIYIRGSEEWTSKANDVSWWEWPANYRQRGKEWERRAEISFKGFGDDTLIHIAGIRINGNATRAFPQKSLRLIFQDGISNMFFMDQNEQNYETMILRNAGNDWGRAFMRDVLVAELSKNLNLETQSAIATNVYLNGEYWGIHYLRPKIDEELLARRYKIEKANICIIEAPLVLYNGDSLGLEEFKDLLDYVESNNLSDSTNFSFVSDQLDINSFIDFILIETFIVNTDWPQNNWMCWKDMSNSYDHGKWKWVLKDTDYGLGFFNQKAYSFNMNLKIKTGTGSISILFNALSQNEVFERSLAERKAYLFSNAWNKEQFENKVDSLEKVLHEEMPFQIDRWRTHLSMEDWKKEVEELKRFYKERLTYF